MTALAIPSFTNLPIALNLPIQAHRCSCWQFWALLTSFYYQICHPPYPLICQFEHTGAYIGKSEPHCLPSALRFAKASTCVLMLANLTFTTLPLLEFANSSFTSLPPLLSSDLPMRALRCLHWQIWVPPLSVHPPLSLNLPPPQSTSLSTFVFANVSQTEPNTIIFICIPTC